MKSVVCILAMFLFLILVLPSSAIADVMSYEDRLQRDQSQPSNPIGDENPWLEDERLIDPHGNSVAPSNPIGDEDPWNSGESVYLPGGDNTRLFALPDLGWGMNTMLAIFIQEGALNSFFTKRPGEPLGEDDLK